MTLADLHARFARLDKLGLGLAKEIHGVRIGKGDDPMLYSERKEYREALQDALAGVEAARVTLAKGIHRQESSAGSEG